MLQRILKRLNDKAFLAEVADGGYEELVIRTRTYCDAEAPQFRTFLERTQIFGPNVCVGVMLMLGYLKRAAEVEAKTKLWLTENMQSITEHWCVLEGESWRESPDAFVRNARNTIDAHCPAFRCVLKIWEISDITIVVGALTLLAFFTRMPSESSSEEALSE